MKPKRYNPKLFSLAGLTCEQLADLLETSPSAIEPEAPQLVKLRSLLCKEQDRKLLRMCGDKSARFWRSSMRTAEIVAELMSRPVSLMIGGGMPKQQEMPSYTPAVRKMAAAHGIVAHRWGKGCFVLAK